MLQTIVEFVVLAGGATSPLFATLPGTVIARLHPVLASLSGVPVMILAPSHPLRGDFHGTVEPFQAALARMDGS